MATHPRHGRGSLPAGSPEAGPDDSTAKASLHRALELRDEDIERLRHQLDVAERELVDLRAIRDALTPPELPSRPALDAAAAFLPATAEQVSGDFYLVAAGPQDATVLVVGDVVGHGLDAARRAAFVRTAFITAAPYTDDPSQLLSWGNAALIERAGTEGLFVTAACATYLPKTRLLRWAYAGHPQALRLDDGRPLVAGNQGTPLGIAETLDCIEGSSELTPGAGILLYTDGLTEARHGEAMFGVEAVSAVLADLQSPSPGEAIAVLRSRVTDFAYGGLTDDLCMLAARTR